VPAKILKARRNSMEWWQYAWEGTRIRNKLWEYEGFNFVIDKTKWWVLKLKWIEITWIPKWHIVKSVETIEINWANVYHIKIKESWLKGKTYEIQIHEHIQIDPIISRLAIEEKALLGVVYNKDWSINFYKIGKWKDAKFYNKKGEEIPKTKQIKTQAKEADVLLEPKKLTIKEQIEIKKKVQELWKTLLSNKTEYIKKFGKWTFDQTMSLLKWIANNPKNILLWWLIWWGTYYILWWKAEADITNTKESITKTLDETKENIQNWFIEKMMEKISNMNPMDYWWNNND
jgi:hypothetical protein